MAGNATPPPTSMSTDKSPSNSSPLPIVLAGLFAALALVSILRLAPIKR
jgi:hypothetical protein